MVRRFLSAMERCQCVILCFSALILYSFLVCPVESVVPASRSLTSNNSVNLHDTAPTHNATEELPPPQGWTPQPDGRGTIDIIWACILTIFLCSWSVLCLNLPAPEDGFWLKFRRRIYLTGLGILGPEFVLMLAIGQWESARRSVKEMKELRERKELQLSGNPEWSMSHAFFADMGGFVLQARTSVGTTDPNAPRKWASFPLNAKQIHYLVAEGYMKYSAVAVDKRVITDKNKADFLVRAITVCQTLWFVLSCIGRAVQHLTITTFELTTLGFIVCTLATVFCWGHKPSDVETAITVEISQTIDKVLVEAGDRAQQPYNLTPLDFVSRKEWFWTLCWSYWFNILKKCHVKGITIKVRPVDRLGNPDFPELSPRAMATLFLINFIFAAINICGWNFWFPSRTERLLWRISAPMLPGSVCVFFFWEKFVWQVLPALKKRFPKPSATRDRQETVLLSHWPGTKHILDKAKSTAARLRNISPERDPALDVPLKAILPLTFIAAFYCIARAYILVEDVIALRALPPSAYETVNWSELVPHL